jgi:MFS family permease/ABC-type cobalamin/Fe3+-siderophores transport system ATPase subunit
LNCPRSWERTREQWSGEGVTRFPRVKGGLAAVVAEGFFSRLSFGLVTFGLPLYAFRLGMSLAEIGILTSINLIVAIVLKPLMGWVADRVGLKASLTVAIALRSLVSLLLVFAGSAWQLIAVRSLHGVSIALRDPAVGALVAELGGKKAIASSFAWYQTGKSVAGSVGKALAGLLLAVTASSFPTLFVVSLVLSTIPLFVVLRFVPDEEHGSRLLEPHRSSEEAGEGGPRRISTAPYVLLGLMISATAYMMANLFPILATEYGGLNEAQTGAIYLIGAVLALSGPAWGWVADHMNNRVVLSVRGIANVASSALYLLTPNFFGFAVGRALDDTGKAAFRPAWGALMARVASLDKRRRARVIGRVSSGEDAGEVIGPIAAGLLWSAWGVATVLVARIVLALITEIYAAKVMRSLEASGAPFGARLVKRRRSRTALTHKGAALPGAEGGVRPDLRPGPGRLAFHDVRMADAIDGFDAVAEPGVVTAVIPGDPAAGRAFMDLLAGTRFPDRGEVYLDGQPLSRHSTVSVRRAISVLHLDPPPADTPIGAVLRQRWPEAPPEELARAWWVAGLVDVLGHLPALAEKNAGDLDPVTGKAVTLAARIVGDPAVLVLDEARLRPSAKLAPTLGRIISQHRGAVLVINPLPRRLKTAPSVITLSGPRVSQLTSGSAGAQEVRARSDASLTSTGIRWTALFE